LGSPECGGVLGFEIEVSIILEEVESELLFVITRLILSTPSFESINGVAKVITCIGF
jgi:hypothetical protein